MRAIQCSYEPDTMQRRVAPDGSLRYVRSDSPVAEEYSYRRPFILELEITRRCNLRCVHCYADATDIQCRDELTHAEITSVLDQATALGIPDVSLTGGEVLLHPHFMAIIDECVARQRHVRFVTNATVMTDDLLHGLCQRPIKLITISLDAISPDLHDRIRGSGAHARVLRHIHELIAAGFRVSIITAFSRLNVEDFDRLLAFCVDHRIDWQVQMVSAKGRCHRDIVFSPDEYYALGDKLAHAYTLDLPMNIIPMDDMATFSVFAPLDALSTTWQGVCTGGLLNIFVRANGDVTPCSALAFPECVVGNVRKDSLAQICGEERCRENLSWLLDGPRTGFCATCRFLQQCRGGCPDILMSMCDSRTDNQFCYRRIEETRIIEKVLGP